MSRIDLGQARHALLQGATVLAGLAALTSSAAASAHPSAAADLPHQSAIHITLGDTRPADLPELHVRYPVTPRSR